MVRIMKQSSANDAKRNNEGARGDDSGSSSMHEEPPCLLVPVCQGKSTGSGLRN